MTEAGALLAALQHGDSFFPAGGFAFSWGLETLRADGVVTDKAALGRFVEGQLRHRWATCDRPALVAAHRAGGEVGPVLALDAELDALALAAAARAGSRRSGRALLGVHARLGTPGAAEYRALVRDGAAPGHVAAMQGMLWRAAGLSEAAATALSAHVLCTGFAAAALRLNLIGHLDAQRLLSGLRPLVEALLAAPLPPRPAAYAPEAEIAMMRHEARDVRLFAN